MLPAAEDNKAEVELEQLQMTQQSETEQQPGTVTCSVTSSVMAQLSLQMLCTFCGNIAVT